MILNKDQAKAIYDAMCSLNNVLAKCKATFPGTYESTFTNVFEHPTGEVHVVSVYNWHVVGMEEYKSQNDFATAYGVD